MTDIALVRCDITATISVYRGDTWLGRVYCPTSDGPPKDDFTAAPWNGDPVDGFATEDAATGWLDSYLIQPRNSTP